MSTQDQVALVILEVFKCSRGTCVTVCKVSLKATKFFSCLF